MKYIIQKKSDGLYVSSSKLSVTCKAFARWFKTERQAKNYMYRCGLKSKQVNICTIEPDGMFTVDREKIIAAYRKNEKLG
ncbi:MAG: hypothetical protein J6P14_03775 [Ruminococcus sp.]|jgi:hypothetical protein|nr:hypothetical protein [Ruminococcus sp.]